MLGIWILEMIAMLANILPNVYINPDWSEVEYLQQCKMAAWKKENTINSMKCYNLECTIEAKVFGLKCPDEIEMNEYITRLDDEKFKIGFRRQIITLCFGIEVPL